MRSTLLIRAAVLFYLSFSFLVLQTSVAKETLVDHSLAKTSDDDQQLRWYDAKDIGVEGKAWSDTESFFDRLPARAKGVVRDPVWSLSKHSAGICIRFVSDTDAVHVRWTLTSDRLAMPHMPATGVSGVDLYVRTTTGWKWLAEGQPTKKQNSMKVVDGYPAAKREYLLYLPLYNGVESLELGLPSTAKLWQKTIDGDRSKPIVFWGTSITHGACASRTGMPHVAILGRRFDRPVINLGFSGNGRMEPEVARLIGEIDAAVFVVDCLPNLTGDLVAKRARPVVDILRAARPQTPILLVEDRTYADADYVTAQRERNVKSRAALRSAYEQMIADGIQNVSYLSGNRLLGTDREDTVDSSHPTDLGFYRQANAIEAALRPILGEPTPKRWFKGNLHTHTLWSDGNDFPEMVADWYVRNGYNFLALSDHNVLSEGIRWMKLTDIEKRNGRHALQKYIARFGSDWVETRGSRDDGSLEVRLKPLTEVKSLVDQRGEFLMIQSEEITDNGAHINATNIAKVIEPQGGSTVRETIQNNLRAVAAQAKELGRTIVPHLNHPNLGDKGISAEELAALIQDEFFEVFNGVENDGDLGSERRHSLETLWDITSTLRISKFNAPPLFGLATDDSHHYHGKSNASPGRGWIMLKANRLTPETIVQAMKRGDFYASSGVQLRRVEFDTTSNTLQVEIEPFGEENYTTQFIGTPVDFDPTTNERIQADGEIVEGTRDYSKDVGKVFGTVSGLSPSYKMTGEELYIRAVITSDAAPDNPTSESPLKKAWTQPVGWQAHVK